jgi:hypothetical protein
VPQRDRGRARLQQVLRSINEVKLLCQLVQQVSPSADIGLWHKTQGTLVLRGSFPAGTEFSGTTARSGRMCEHHIGIPRTLSMKGQPGVVITAGGEQRLNDRGVNGSLSIRRNSSLNRHSRYLMTESKIISVLDQQTMADQLIHHE